MSNISILNESTYYFVFMCRILMTRKERYCCITMRNIGELSFKKVGFIYFS